MKYIFLSCLAATTLMGMDNRLYNSNGSCYAKAEQSYLVKGLYIQKVAYPVVINRTNDDKRQAWFNFDNSVASMQWHKIEKGHNLSVILHDGKKYAFFLNY